MESWQQYHISDLISQGILLIGDGYRAKNAEFRSKGIPFARVSNIVNNGFDFTKVDLFPKEDLSKVGNKISHSGDIVFTSKGTVGRFAFVKDEIRPFVYSPQLCFWRVHNTDTIDPGYLFYWMQGPEFTNQCDSVKNQTDMADYVSLKDQRSMKITLPPLPEQHTIARILSSLDDRIELNRKMNATLEAMAQALFRSWFVDFDPVRAKAEGREPAGMDEETAALFPDGFEEVDGREVPVGWTTSTIGEEVQVVGGSTPSTKNPAFWDNGSIHFATPKDMSSLQSSALLETERCITEAGLEKISSGLLPKGTVLLSSRAPIGYLAIAGVPVAVNQGFIAMICNKKLSNYYVLYWTQENMETIKANANGSTFQEISKRNFRPIEVIVPPSKVLGCYNRLIHPIHEQIVCNTRQSRTLATLRDTLLPKLISGEVRVPLGGDSQNAGEIHAEP